jgi:hypothetical protein
VFFIGRHSLFQQLFFSLLAQTSLLLDLQHSLVALVLAFL